jgi:hypothetical protein
MIVYCVFSLSMCPRCGVYTWSSGLISQWIDHMTCEVSWAYSMIRMRPSTGKREGDALAPHVAFDVITSVDSSRCVSTRYEAIPIPPTPTPCHVLEWQPHCLTNTAPSLTLQGQERRSGSGAAVKGDVKTRDGRYGTRSADRAAMPPSNMLNVQQEHFYS